MSELTLDRPDPHAATTPKVVYLTAGAAGMFCGSCLNDNMLVRSLQRHGWDVMLVPTYTPIRTDEEDISVDRVFLGGINVYLQQNIPLLRWLPHWMDRFLDHPRLIRRVTQRAVHIDPATLGRLTLSMLKGALGNQRKEVKRLVRWLARDVQPRLVVFSNILIGGSIPEIKRRLGVPVIVTLQGEDLFLDSLREQDRAACLQQIARITGDVDAFVVHTSCFREYMSEYFDIPAERIDVTPLGIDTQPFQELPEPSTDDSAEHGQRRMNIGYLARLAPEKGLHVFTEAFLRLVEMAPDVPVDLKIAGWLGGHQRAWVQEQFARLDAAGLQERYSYEGTLQRHEKVQFLSQLDLFSVPATYLEPKGRYVLEAMASGVPVVEPDRGAFPELIQPCDGGLLVRPDDPVELARAWLRLLQDDTFRRAMGRRGREYVLSQRNADAMARHTAELYQTVLAQGSTPKRDSSNS